MRDRPGGAVLVIAVTSMVVAASALLRPTTAASQSATAAAKRDDGVPMLVLAPDPAVGKGQVAAVQGSVGPEGIRCRVGGLSILQPVVVMLLARDPGDEVSLSLFKGDWKTARRTGSTKGSGIAQFEFRTQGGINILLRGPAKPVPFALVVWAGTELHPPMKDVVVTYDAFKKRQRLFAPVPSGSPERGR